MVSIIKVKDGVASREPIPAFLQGLLPESLSDLSWTDPALGVQDCAWWPEEDASGELDTNKKWGAEVLTLDVERKVVLVARKQVSMTAAEKAARDALIAAEWAERIAARRWQAETSGTVFGGMPIDTDDRSKLLINGAAMRADRSADYVLRWKTSEGFVDLTAAQVLAVADAVSYHVQFCFDREDVLLGAVADGSITAEMLEEGWPV
ncbi:protein of unknown function [Pseudomonas lundensis]|uniref:DUF4376 domain-containing protein n=1 Tax=Pseudomonas lundensis TaxID=86185 RepID=UPI00088E41CE|nr:DUF4376 domain-containing protein [Pseudomonas lundensis]SDQ79976.1 protein of unknown function [Pseudomonas lundensis]